MCPRRIFAFSASRPLKIGYSDWPGFTILEVAKQKGWFKDAGLDVDLVWFDYLPSLDAFAAGKVDAVTAVATDALVNGANGAKSKIIALLDYSDGSDMIIGKPGIESIKDLERPEGRHRGDASRAPAAARSAQAEWHDAIRRRDRQYGDQ